MLKQLLTYFYENPKRLFLIDGIGAIVSAFLLGIVLVKLESFFGIPISMLYVLASLPVFFAIYDLYSYQKDNDKLTGLLKGIAIMNLLYCKLSIGLTIFHYQKITHWGWTYIIVEVLIIIILAIIELKVAKELNTTIRQRQ
ncbi:hypothetical protein [Aquimarina sp. MMG016]|uniref:hypothetical protein n=1 Tax=Aquimarina sp. MMG016 TaxID=2822690 RepID=UPI001B39EC62|nr:hypothetical protein [Aquimarina sp. MMG016]MBQ4822553.1 hypothetical protein [Aquimarina sp. MMG016]